MKLLKYLVAAFCCLTIVACEEDELSTIGSSLNSSDIVITVDSTFVKLTGESVFNDSILGRTTDPLLGNLTVDNYGTLHTGYLTQFMPTLNIDTTNVTPATLDSVRLYLNYYDTDLTGDSLAPMVLDIYRLNKTIKAPLYTNIDPTDYYSPDDYITSTTFGSSTEGFVDEKTSTTDKTISYKQIKVDLPLSMGEEIFELYKKNPDIFALPATFAEHFPGMYMNISYGNGRVVNVKGIFMTMYYRAINSEGKIDTLSHTYMGVTPEVYSINHFTLTPDATLQQNVAQANASGHRAYIQSPVGYMPIIHFPTQNVIDKYKEKMSETSKIQNILNALSFTIPIVEDPNAVLAPPEYLLFVRASQAKDFFEQKLLPDDISTIYAKYDKGLKAYNFGDISSYIRSVLQREDPTVTEDDETIALIPVNITFETSTNYYTTTTSITSVTPYSASPAFAELDLDGAKIKITYTTQTSD